MKKDKKIRRELLDELLAGYSKPEDLTGPEGLLKSLMGEARDELLHKAGDAAHDAADTLGRLTEKTIEATKSAAGKAEGGTVRLP